VGKPKNYLYTEFLNQNMMYVRESVCHLDKWNELDKNIYLNNFKIISN
jgi:hypothetical protein